MKYLFATPIPVPWLLADLLTLLVTVLVVVFIVRNSLKSKGEARASTG